MAVPLCGIHIMGVLPGVRMLTVEERERLQKEEKLTKADRSISLAVEELSSYRSATGHTHTHTHK